MRQRKGKMTKNFWDHMRKPVPKSTLTDLKPNLNLLTVETTVDF